MIDHGIGYLAAWASQLVQTAGILEKKHRQGLMQDDLHQQRIIPQLPK